MMGIYKITCLVNNKVYIGQSKDIIRRLSHHKTLLKHNKHSNEHLQSAHNKYGLDNFTFETLEECIEDDIDLREVYWINIHNSTDRTVGFNIQVGGCITKSHSDESKIKMSHSHMGKKLLEETKTKIGNANKGENNILYGKHLSDEVRYKISQSKKGCSSWCKGKKLPPSWNKGKPWSDDAKLKMSEARKGKSPANKGVPMSDEQKRKLSESKKGNIPGNKIKVTEEMIGDFKNGMLRKEFRTKYNVSQTVWDRIKREYLNQDAG